MLAKYNDNKSFEKLGCIPKNCSGYIEFSYFSRMIETTLLDNRVLTVTAVLGCVRDGLSYLSETDATVLFHKVLNYLYHNFRYRTSNRMRSMPHMPYRHAAATIRRLIL